MRKVDENRAENYIKKHGLHKKWLVFALCLSLLTGTITLYVLNKPATAMTEEGAKQVGLVLETADSEFEQGLIDQMEEQENQQGAAGASKQQDENSSSEDGSATESSNDQEDSSAASEASAAESSESSSASSDEAAADASTEASSDASSEASSDASSESSSEAVTDASAESSSAEKEEKKEVSAKDVVIKVNYEDLSGEAISESKELSIEESFDLTKEVRSFEGYVFSQGVINDTEVVKITKQKKTAASDNEDSAAAGSSDEKEYIFYKAMTAAGEEKDITEDAELHLKYYKVNTQTEFTASDSKVTAKAVISDPTSLPAGIQLCIAEISSKTQDYNYDAYMQALNDNAEKIADESNQEKAQSYDETNTLLYDIAFKLDGVEYQPTAGTVSISLTLNQNQISDSFGSVSSDSVNVVHLPVSDEVMDNVDATSEASDITASDISVEVVQSSDVDLSGDTDKVSFETDSFSAYALIYNSDGIISWEGTEEISAKQIAEALGDNTMFGAVARVYEASGDADIEANIAVGTLKKIIEFGNTSSVYTHVSFDGYYVTKKSTRDGDFTFGLFSDEYTDANRNPARIGTFDIAVNNGSGTVNLLEKFSNSELQKYARIYIYELDPDGNIVPNGESFVKDGSTFTVTYVTNDFQTESDNDIIGSFSSSYVENNATGESGEILASRLQDVDGNTLYIKNSDSSYTVYTHPDNLQGTTVQGSFPISVSNMLTAAYSVSEKIALAKNTDDVVVVNAIGTSDGFRKDVTKALLRNYNEDQLNNYLTNAGIDIGNKLLIINLDLTNCRSYTIQQFLVKTASNPAGSLTGRGWEEIANQIIINPLQRTGDNTLVPYTGTLTLDTASGTVIAPEAYVDIFSGAHPGAVIADYIYQRKEIHKFTTRRYLDKQASMTISNVGEDAETFEINVDKYVDNKLATDAHTGKFTFTLVMLRKHELGYNYWEILDTNITNEGSSIKYEIKPSLLGMTYGRSNAADDHTYYFALFENDDQTGTFKKDDSSILIKIKYYAGGEKEPLYYRIDAAESQNLQSNPGTGYYNTQHRISKSGATEAMKNVAFYNTTAETVDIEVTKAWILNGRDAGDIPSDPSQVVLTLYQTVLGVTTPVDATKYPYEVITSGVDTDVNKADTAWKFVWKKLPKKDANGNTIKYTVAETTVPDGFSSDTPESKPKELVFESSNYNTQRETGSKELGTATIINKGASFKLQLYKYLDNVLATEKFDFRLKIVEYNNGKNKWISHDDTHISSDENGSITYTIDPNKWLMYPGNTYILRMDEYSYSDDSHRKDKGNSKAYKNYLRDQGNILIKVVYNSVNDIDITYYRIDDENIVAAIRDNCSLAKNYCTPEYEVKDEKVAFYNSTTENITIVVTKEWDELVGLPKNGKLVTDNIFDVTFKLLRSEDGNNWEVAEEYTIKTPRMYQTEPGGDFTAVEYGDYPEVWDYRSNPITFNNMSSKYQYKIQEWYGGEMLGEAMYTTYLNGKTINGYKLSQVVVETDEAGNIDFTLHNKPYLQVYKYWKLNGEPTSYEDTADYNPVYVKIYRYYRRDDTRVQLSYDMLLNATPEQYKQYIMRDPSNPSCAIVQLCYANGWYCEFSVDRKQDNGPNDDHVYQYVYQMQECDSNGVNCPESPYILYGGQSLYNVTRTTTDYNYQRGFDGDNIEDKTDWRAAVAKGNNHPVNVLTVTNNLGTSVLPNSGGIGDKPFAVIGISLAAIALAGFAVFKLSRRKKKIV